MIKYYKKNFKFKKKFENVKEGEVGYYDVVDNRFEKPDFFKFKNIDRDKGTCMTFLISKNVCNKNPGNTNYNLKSYISKWLFLKNNEELNKRINFQFLKD